MADSGNTDRNNLIRNADSIFAENRDKNWEKKGRESVRSDSWNAIIRLLYKITIL